MYRLQILENTLSLPSYQKFAEALSPSLAELADHFFKALWHQYLNNKGAVSLPYWSDRFDNPKAFNQVLISLSKSNWIVCHSIPARNWAEAHINEDKLLQYVSSDELEQVRAANKFSKYRLEHSISSKTNATRLNGHIRDTGLVREGFMKAGNTSFQYNKHYMDQYSDIIQQNLTKSMDKIAEYCPNLRHDRASYDTISIDILDFYLHNNDTYTRGHNYNDSRGRAISSSLSKVGNPISCKDFRALLEIPV